MDNRKGEIIMEKTTIYTYLGTNGVINSPVHLEGIYSVKKIRLKAEKGKVITKDGVNFFNSVVVPENEVDQ
jgi:hypothetical protein